MIVRAVDNQKDDKINILPTHPFTILVNGAKGGGKSSLVINLLTNPEGYKNKFNKIIFISPTYEMDEKIQKLKTQDILLQNIPLAKEINKRIKRKKKSIMDENNTELIHLEDLPTKMDVFYKELNQELLQEIMNEQKQIIDMFGKKLSDKILLILDDSIMSRFLQSKYFINFVLLSRHYNFSIIFCSQAYYNLQKSLRLNTTSLVLFDNSNEKEIDMISREWNCGIPRNEFLQIYYETVREPYKFLQINSQNIKGKRLTYCFEKFI